MDVTTELMALYSTGVASVIVWLLKSRSTTIKELKAATTAMLTLERKIMALQVENENLRLELCQLQSRIETLLFILEADRDKMTSSQGGIYA